MEKERTKVFIQGEADNSTEAGSVIFFNTEHELKKGDKIEVGNRHKTILAKWVIMEGARKFYKAVQISSYPIENRLDITDILS